MCHSFIIDKTSKVSKTGRLVSFREVRGVQLWSPFGGLFRACCNGREKLEGKDTRVETRILLHHVGRWTWQWPWEEFNELDAEPRGHTGWSAKYTNPTCSWMPCLTCRTLPDPSPGLCRRASINGWARSEAACLAVLGCLGRHWPLHTAIKWELLSTSSVVTSAYLAWEGNEAEGIWWFWRNI